MSKTTLSKTAGSLSRTALRFGVGTSLLALIAVLSLTGRANAGAITPGNLVVLRIGSGATALSSAAQAVYLDEYSTVGALVQSIALPTVTSGPQRRITLSGSSTTEGFLNISADGRYILVAGYDVAPGASNPASATAANDPRVIARIDMSGNIDTSTALSDASTAAAVRSADSLDGSGFWIAGGAGGVRYAPLGALLSIQVSAAPTNARNLRIFNNQLFITSSASGFVGVNMVGSGLQTSGGQTTTLLPSFTGTSPYDCFFADPNTVYVADDTTGSGGGLQKWVFNGSTWSKTATFDPSLAPAGAANKALTGVTGYINSIGQPVLFSTGAGAGTAQNKIYTITDAGGSSTFSNVAAPATNTIIRGIRYIGLTPPDPITGCTPPTFIAQPTTSAVFCNGAATATNLTIAATGTGLSYQWQQSTDGATWINATTGSGLQTASYTTPSTISVTTQYRCLAITPCGVLASSPATVQILALPGTPSGAASYFGNVGSPIAMTVSVPDGATADWSVQSCGGGAAAPGAAGVTTLNFTPSINGVYTFYVRSRDMASGCLSATCLAITVTALTSNDQCAGAVPIALDTPVTGSLATAANDYQVAAASPPFLGSGQTPTIAAGRDVVYTFQPTFSGSYSFKVYRGASTSNLVLYVTNICPSGATPITIPSANVIAASNRNTSSSSNAAEEVFCVSLVGGAQYWVFVDENTLTAGSTFLLEVNRCSQEVEPNDTVAQATPYVFGTAGMEGTLTSSSDVDFYSLGVVPSGSRIFAMTDTSAANSGDTVLRVTTATNTLEYDDDDGDPAFGLSGFSSVCAGTPGTGVPTYLRVSIGSASSLVEPYRLYAIVQPPIGSATVEVEPNNTIAAAQSSATNYFSGSLSSLADIDIYSFTATAGQLIFVAMDCSPNRGTTAIDGVLALLDSTGAVLITVNGGTTTNGLSTAAGTTLTSNTPTASGEALVWRAQFSGTYYVRVSPNAGTNLPGPYLLSVVSQQAPLTGACCAGGGGCSSVTSAACTASSGSFRGEGVTCANVSCVGACRKPDGTCASLSIDGCAAASGQFQAFGAPCPPSGACCTASSCSIKIDLAPYGCTQTGGTYFGDNTICPSVLSSASSDTDAYCDNAAPDTITLTALGGSGIAWYTGSCGGSFVGSDSPLTISAPAATTTYYARSEGGACASACVSTTVTVNTSPAQPFGITTSDDHFCSGSIPTITLTADGGSGTSIEWFNGPCGGTSIGSANPLIIAAPTATTIYSVRYATVPCGPSGCASITITVDGALGACCTGSGAAKVCTILPAASCAGPTTPSRAYRGNCSTCTPTACCGADFNNSGLVQVNDIFAFLSAWFAQAPEGDYDNSGPPPQVNDIFIFLSHWFGGC